MPSSNWVWPCARNFAEDQARRRKQVFLNDWKARLDDFLRFNERAVLPHAGRVSRETADRKAVDEYEKFAARRRTELEAAGEADALRQLEATARKLPKRKTATPSGGGST